MYIQPGFKRQLVYMFLSLFSSFFSFPFLKIRCTFLGCALSLEHARTHAGAHTYRPISILFWAVGCLATRPPNLDPPSQAHQLMFHCLPLTCHLGMRTPSPSSPPTPPSCGKVVSPRRLRRAHFLWQSFFLFCLMLGLVCEVLSVNPEDGFSPRGVDCLRVERASLSVCACKMDVGPPLNDW